MTSIPGRRHGSWLLPSAAAIAVVAAGAALGRQPLSLAPPPELPGLAEWLAVAGARAGHGSAAGEWILRTNAGVLAAAVALFLVVLRRLGVAWRAALPAALALTLSAALDPALVPLQPLGLVAAALFWIGAMEIARAPGRGVRAVAVIGLIGTALIAPNLSIPIAVLAAWVAGREAGSSSTATRGLLAVASAAVVLALAAGITSTLPRLPPAIDLMASNNWLTAFVHFDWRRSVFAAGDVTSEVGPLAVALAMLAVFSHRTTLGGRRVWPLIAFTLLPIVLPGPAGGQVRWLAPSLFGVWVVVAIGVHEMTAGSGVRAKVVLVVLAVLVPALRVARPVKIVAREFAPRGHERVALDDLKRLVGAMPDGAVVVHADAVSDVLLRALDGAWQRMGKSLRAEPPPSPALRATVESGRAPVFALPSAQEQVLDRGFQLEDVDLAGSRAVAEVRPGGACATIDSTWHELPELTRSGSFALVSAGDWPAGTLLVYTAHDRRLDGGPRDWPADVARGLNASRFTSGIGVDGVRLDDAVRKDGLSLESLGANRHDVVRFEWWRLRGAPSLLVMTLSDRPTRVLARLAPAALPGGVSICPVFAHEPRRF